jgi:hypothetical protein
MAKKKSFGQDKGAVTDRSSMTKVIISKKLSNNTYAFKEAMVEDGNVNDYISENKS